MVNKIIFKLIKEIEDHNNFSTKQQLQEYITKKFNLTKDRSVYYNKYFAIRFSSSSKGSFSNTIISLSRLQKFDDIPFIVCLFTPGENLLFLANTSLINKISHSSAGLTQTNIKGSLNGSDIMKVVGEIQNSPAHFEALFSLHLDTPKSESLQRLVENTHNIVPSGIKYVVQNKIQLLESVDRAILFNKSNEFKVLKSELDQKVKLFKNEILLASLIDNQNIRGRVIEYIIAGENEILRTELLYAIKHNTSIPEYPTKNTIGDFTKIFNKYTTATDVKTKIMILSSQPKAYNIDKILQYLEQPNSIFLFYFVGILSSEINANDLKQSLISVFQENLINSIRIYSHWAGRNSRGVTQFNGEVINNLIIKEDNTINRADARNFLKKLIDL